jgi:metallo-beta-lactamase class B
MRHIARIVTALLLLLATTSPARAQANDWLQPFPAFRIAGNLYYVGSKGLAAYLITTPQGHILINSNLEESVPMIRASVEKLGFKYSDIRILLISHAHWDHDAGSALITQQTGARYMVMEGDVPVVESGGTTDFQYGSDKGTLYKPVKVDRILKDGDEVKLGDTVLVARLTAGHTKGCTTWTMTVKDGTKSYQAVIVGSPNVNPGYRLVKNAAYPAIADDYARGFKVLAGLPADLFLGAHGAYFDMEAKYARLQKGDTEAFVDRDGYRKFVTAKTAEFEAELRKQQTAAK